MSGADRYIFDSAATVACLPLLDGTREVADIATELSDRFAPRQIARAIASLVVPGLVVDGPVIGTQDETAWLDALGTGSAEGFSALSSACFSSTPNRIEIAFPLFAARGRRGRRAAPPSP